MLSKMERHSNDNWSSQKKKKGKINQFQNALASLMLVANDPNQLRLIS